MSADDRSTVEQALATFIDAFNQLDWDRFRACFTTDATQFHPAGVPGRVTGAAFDEAWQRVFAGIQAASGKSAPPFHDVRPLDLLVQSAGEVAVATFHLRGVNGLGRRTIVLRHAADGWRIIHLHASNRELA